MAIRDIILFPDPILKEICGEIKNIDHDIHNLLKDLEDTLYNSPGVGLAAPQIGTTLRAMVIDVTRPPPSGRPAAKGHGLITILNPKITKKEGLITFREGCLSIPEFLANIKRSSWIRLEGVNQRGEETKIEAEGFEAVAIQHELDHLDGILFLDKVVNIKTDLFRRRLKKK